MVDGALPQRQHEFATGRACARRALSALGVEPTPLLRNRRGAPQWPEGVVGSMTHCAGYRATAVARRSEILGLGIDAEPNELLPDGVLETIALPREQSWVNALSHTAPEIHWDRLLFSIKESVFKAWYPLTHRELDFDEALVELDPDATTFSARLLIPAPTVGGRRLDHFDGHWLCRDGLLITATTLLPTPPPDPHPLSKDSAPAQTPEPRKSPGHSKCDLGFN
ncbi:4'-phosphopantetheinyl transferase family protein [Streptomyces sp. 8N114]|uniref:4'-phosphopantetheinyl transferase family protein n=1 Tax=Streptomyces sp. 8N114 TaxID=3457419 RepID=UPI003FCEEB46